MDPIGQVNPVLDLLRKQLAQNVERLRRAGRLADRPRAAGAASSAETLHAALRRRVAGLDLRSPEGRATAVRGFVEAVLTSEFGSELLTDAAFSDMVNEVSASFAEAPGLSERLATALAAL